MLDAARARLRHAEAILYDHGSKQEAAHLVTQARASAETAGAKPLVEDADLLASRARLNLRPVPEVAETAQLGKRYGLTARESEVLAYLAAGRTNRQIAVGLFISDKTASVHVSNLLRKLGVQTRVQAGAIAQHLGLELKEQ